MTQFGHDPAPRHVTEAPHPSDPPSSALQSLIVDHGVGTMLGAAIGDVAVRRHHYSSRTQAATVVAYHLLEHGEIQAESLTEAMLELGRPGDSVFAAPSHIFVSWLESVAMGRPAATVVPAPELATRVIPLGVWFRDDPEALVAAVVELCRLESLDAQTIITAVASAGAVAAATLAMSGWDLVLAASETALLARHLIDRREIFRRETAEVVPRALEAVVRRVGLPYGEVVEGLSGVDGDLHAPLAAIVMAADTEGAPALIIESAGLSGGVDASVVAGAVLAARLGLRRWPWRVANETWFAEIGRRLVDRQREWRDLPIPRSVEARMRSAQPIDPAREID